MAVWIATATGHKAGAAVSASKVSTGAGIATCEGHTFTVDYPGQWFELRGL